MLVSVKAVVGLQGQEGFLWLKLVVTLARTVLVCALGEASMDTATLASWFDA